jgi:anti-sigma B factor antagonist
LEVPLSPHPVFHVTVEPVEDACVIRAVGEVDMSTVDRLRAPLEAARRDGVTALLDLSGVTFIDSTGLHVMLDAARASEEAGWAWFLVRPSVPVRRLLELTGTERLLPLVAADQSDGELVRRRSAAPRVA